MKETTDTTIAKLHTAKDIVLTLGIERKDITTNAAATEVYKAACAYLLEQFAIGNSP